ncbi:hypothetical protein FY528_18980 [Hymenobacter lutimineralis]|uniref:Entericidin n=1 Tax=Hymenobacter lutimineralis TaxID=2606448 RepID=A0A5D6URA6_9BACT|nr:MULTISPECIES: hypothetical protein [Hymenobacter]QIX59908.1 hypothetical protein HER32_01345 [Hymenobacter sp. BT18]TYZ06221.1 hypothetical protein FY528_18980 [Hymenobacter lutimineralis]
MKLSFKSLVLFSAFAAFATTSCSERQQENTEAATENAVDQAGDATSEAANEVQADMATEPGDTAVVQNKEADKLVEKVPATPQN